MGNIEECRIMVDIDDGDRHGRPFKVLPFLGQEGECGEIFPYAVEEIPVASHIMYLRTSAVHGVRTPSPFLV